MAVTGDLAWAHSSFFLAFPNVINHLLSEYTVGQSGVPALEKGILPVTHTGV